MKKNFTTCNCRNIWKGTNIIDEQRKRIDQFTDKLLEMR